MRGFEPFADFDQGGGIVFPGAQGIGAAFTGGEGHGARGESGEGHEGAGGAVGFEFDGDAGIAKVLELDGGGAGGRRGEVRDDAFEDGFLRGGESQKGEEEGEPAGGVPSGSTYPTRMGDRHCG